MVMTVALWFDEPVAVLRTEAPVAVAVITDPLASVVVRRTTTPVAPELDDAMLVVELLPTVVVTVATAPPAPSVVVNAPPVESVPVLTTIVLVPAD